MYRFNNAQRSGDGTQGSREDNGENQQQTTPPPASPKDADATRPPRTQGLLAPPTSTHPISHEKGSNSSDAGSGVPRGERRRGTNSTTEGGGQSSYAEGDSRADGSDGIGRAKKPSSSSTATRKHRSGEEDRVHPAPEEEAPTSDSNDRQYLMQAPGQPFLGAKPQDVFSWYRKTVGSHSIIPPPAWRRVRFQLPRNVAELYLRPSNPEVCVPHDVVLKFVENANRSAAQGGFAGPQGAWGGRRGGLMPAPRSQGRGEGTGMRPGTVESGEFVGVAAVAPATIVIQLDEAPEGTSLKDYKYSMVRYIFDLLSYQQASTAISMLRFVKLGSQVSQLVVSFGQDSKLATQMVSNLVSQNLSAGFVVEGNNADQDMFMSESVDASGVYADGSGDGAKPADAENKGTPANTGSGSNSKYKLNLTPDDLLRMEGTSPNATFQITDFLLTLHGGKGISREDVLTLLTPDSQQQQQQQQRDGSGSGDSEQDGQMNISVIESAEEGVFYAALKRPDSVYSWLWNPFCSFQLQRDFFIRYGVLLTMAPCKHDFIIQGVPSYIQKREKEKQKLLSRNQLQGDVRIDSESDDSEDSEDDNRNEAGDKFKSAHGGPSPGIQAGEGTGARTKNIAAETAIGVAGGLAALSVQRSDMKREVDLFASDNVEDVDESIEALLGNETRKKDARVAGQLGPVHHVDARAQLAAPAAAPLSGPYFLPPDRSGHGVKNEEPRRGANVAPTTQFSYPRGRGMPLGMKKEEEGEKRFSDLDLFSDIFSGGQQGGRQQSVNAGGFNNRGYTQNSFQSRRNAGGGANLDFPELVSDEADENADADERGDSNRATNQQQQQYGAGGGGSGATYGSMGTYGGASRWGGDQNVLANQQASYGGALNPYQQQYYNYSGASSGMMSGVLPYGALPMGGGGSVLQQQQQQQALAGQGAPGSQSNDDFSAAFSRQSKEEQLLRGVQDQNAGTEGGGLLSILGDGQGAGTASASSASVLHADGGGFPATAPFGGAQTPASQYALQLQELSALMQLVVTPSIPEGVAGLSHPPIGDMVDQLEDLVEDVLQASNKDNSQEAKTKEQMDNAAGKKFVAPYTHDVVILPPTIPVRNVLLYLRQNMRSILMCVKEEESTTSGPKALSVLQISEATQGTPQKQGGNTSILGNEEEEKEKEKGEGVVDTLPLLDENDGATDLTSTPAKVNNTHDANEEDPANERTVKDFFDSLVSLVSAPITVSTEPRDVVDAEQESEATATEEKGVNNAAKQSISMSDHIFPYLLMDTYLQPIVAELIRRAPHTMRSDAAVSFFLPLFFHAEALQWYIASFAEEESVAVVEEDVPCVHPLVKHVLAHWSDASQWLHRRVSFLSQQSAPDHTIAAASLFAVLGPLFGDALFSTAGYIQNPAAYFTPGYALQKTKLVSQMGNLMDRLLSSAVSGGTLYAELQQKECKESFDAVLELPVEGNKTYHTLEACGLIGICKEKVSETDGEVETALSRKSIQFFWSTEGNDYRTLLRLWLNANLISGHLVADVFFQPPSPSPASSTSSNSGNTGAQPTKLGKEQYFFVVAALSKSAVAPTLNVETAALCGRLLALTERRTTTGSCSLTNELTEKDATQLLDAVMRAIQAAGTSAATTLLASYTQNTKNADPEGVLGESKEKSFLEAREQEMKRIGSIFEALRNAYFDEYDGSKVAGTPQSTAALETLLGKRVKYASIVARLGGANVQTQLDTAVLPKAGAAEDTGVLKDISATPQTAHSQLQPVFPMQTQSSVFSFSSSDPILPLAAAQQPGESKQYYGSILDSAAPQGALNYNANGGNGSKPVLFQSMHDDFMQQPIFSDDMHTGYGEVYSMVGHSGEWRKEWTETFSTYPAVGNPFSSGLPETWTSRIALPSGEYTFTKAEGSGDETETSTINPVDLKTYLATPQAIALQENLTESDVLALCVDADDENADAKNDASGSATSSSSPSDHDGESASNESGESENDNEETAQEGDDKAAASKDTTEKVGNPPAEASATNPADTDNANETEHVSEDDVRNWKADQRVRHAIIDAAILKKFEVRYPYQPSSSDATHPSSFHGTSSLLQPPTTQYGYPYGGAYYDNGMQSAHRTPQYGNYEGEATVAQANVVVGNQPLLDSFTFSTTEAAKLQDQLYILSETYPPRGQPFPRLAPGIVYIADCSTGLFLFRTLKNTNSPLEQKHPVTGKEYRVSPQFLVFQRRIPVPFLTSLVNRALLLSHHATNPTAEQEKETIVSSADKSTATVPAGDAQKSDQRNPQSDSAGETSANSSPRVVSEAEVKAWMENQRSRDMDIDYIVAKMIAITYCPSALYDDVEGFKKRRFRAHDRHQHPSGGNRSGPPPHHDVHRRGGGGGDGSGGGGESRRRRGRSSGGVREGSGDVLMSGHSRRGGRGGGDNNNNDRVVAAKRSDGAKDNNKEDPDQRHDGQKRRRHHHRHHSEEAGSRVRESSRDERGDGAKRSRRGDDGGRHSRGGGGGSGRAEEERPDGGASGRKRSRRHRGEGKGEAPSSASHASDSKRRRL